MIRVERSVRGYAAWRAQPMALTAFALFVAAAPALAHPGHSRSSRLIKLDLSAEPPRVGYALVFEPAASDAARERADADDDGKVSNVEGQAELDRLGQELRSALTICAGHSLETLRCAKVTPADALEVAASGFSVPPGKTLAMSWEFRVNLRAADRAVRVDDAWTRPEVDRTDALIEAKAGVELALAGPESVPNNRVTREFQWADDRPHQPRRLFAVWESPTPRWLVSVIVAAATLAMATHFVMRWRRTRASEVMSSRGLGAVSESRHSSDN